jgi:hypothetical protein
LEVVDGSSVLCAACFCCCSSFNFAFCFLFDKGCCVSTTGTDGGGADITFVDDDEDEALRDGC